MSDQIQQMSKKTGSHEQEEWNQQYLVHYFGFAAASGNEISKFTLLFAQQNSPLVAFDLETLNSHH